MKLAICMWYDEGVKDYADLCKQLNESYCKKNKYDFIYSDERLLPNKLPHYERYPLLLNHIKKYDWIVWIDADAFFYKDARPLETIIEHIKFSHDNILSLNIRQTFSNIPIHEINNGVFILKNTKDNIKFLKRMMYCDDIIEIAEKNHYIYDQAVFRYLYCENYENFKKNSYVVNYGVLQHFYQHEINHLNNKPFILHMAGSHQNREEIVKNYINKNI